MFATQTTQTYPRYGAVPMQPAAQRSPAAKWMTCISWMHFAAMWGLIGLIHGVSESWWLGTMVVYLPRAPWVIPALILVPLSMCWGWKPAVINVAAGLLALGPVMNWQSGGFFKPAIDREAYRLTIVSCNVQSFRPKFDQVVQELDRIDPDVVVFQEAFEDHALLAVLFEGWNVHRVNEYLVASKLPLKFISTTFVPGFERVTAVRYEVETPMGPVTVFNVHQTSPRHSLTELKPWSPLTGTGV
ncbi:MAG: Endonuclease/Exonuclease/phosphatase family protein, partial [Planctomycetaceae bacterium]|nr:Endonuclease/Exonuclease/phosphatase family protein [Planctomycetaceae bacterium]